MRSQPESLPEAKFVEVAPPVPLVNFASATTPESLPNNDEDGLELERQLKVGLWPVQIALAAHGPDSPEFLASQKEVAQTIAQSHLDPAQTRLAETTRLLLSPDSPLRKR